MKKKQVVLFCEGKESSWDYQILQKIIASIDGVNTHLFVQPLGGVKGSYSLVKGFLMRKGIPKYELAIYLRDRDFDYEYKQLSKPQLVAIKPEEGKNAILDIDTQAFIYNYATYKITIENYLIMPELLSSFVNELKKTTFSTQKMEELMERAARKILYYQIIRHTLGAIRKPIFLKPKFHFDAYSSLKKEDEVKSGILPKSEILENFEQCKAEGLRQLKNYHSEVDTITENLYEEKLAFFEKEFSSDTFWANKHYLTWFQGKDLMTAINQELSNQNCKLSDKEIAHYYTYSVDKQDFIEYPELKQFQDIITQKMNA